MTVEPHPYPERPVWRMGPPVAATVLAAVGFVVMLGMPAGPTRTAALVVVLVMQVALIAGRGISLRQAARAADGLATWHQFFFAWSFFAGVTHLLGSHNPTAAAPIHVVAGLIFAALLTGAFWAMNRTPRP